MISETNWTIHFPQFNFCFMVSVHPIDLTEPEKVMELCSILGEDTPSRLLNSKLKLVLKLFVLKLILKKEMVFKLFL